MLDTRFTLMLLRALGIAVPAHAQWIGRPEPAWEKEFHACVADPHTKVFSGSFGRDLATRQIEVRACRNEWGIVQPGSHAIRFPPGWTRRGGS